MKFYLSPMLNELNELDRYFDRLFHGSAHARHERDWGMTSDYKETEEAVYFSIDLPGVKKEDIDVQLKDNVLSISAERKSKTENGRSYGKYQQSFTVPNKVNAEKLEVNYEDGVLTFALPKVEEAKAKKIDVAEGKGGLFQRLIGND